MHKILLFLFFYLYLYQSVYAEYRQLKIPFRVAGEDVLSSAYLKIYVDNISRSYDDYVRWEGSGESIVNFLNSIQFRDTCLDSLDWISHREHLLLAVKAAFLKLKQIKDYAENPS